MSKFMQIEDSCSALNEAKRIASNRNVWIKSVLNKCDSSSCSRSDEAITVNDSTLNRSSCNTNKIEWDS